jgi:hypothetical protein
VSQWSALLLEKTREARKKKTSLVGGFNHLEEYESQLETLSHILWNIKNV